MWSWYWFIVWPTGTTPPSASKVRTSMEVATVAVVAGVVAAAEVTAAAAVVAEMVAEVEWLRAEVAVVEVVRRTR